MSMNALGIANWRSLGTGGNGSLQQLLLPPSVVHVEETSPPFSTLATP